MASLDLLSVTQTAASIGVTAATLHNWWKRDSGPTRTRIGGRVFVSREALAAWLAARVDRSAQEFGPGRAAA